MRLVWGTVTSIVEASPAVERLTVLVDGASAPHRAVSYPPLAGACAQGERVLCNTTAVDLGLGTGGEHFVVARAGEGVMLDDPAPGHIMKLRYTPLQRDVTTVEEPASPHHDVMVAARSLDGLPVVCCGLHSQVPIVAAAVRERAPHSRIAYVMTDESALPMALSRLVPRMLDAGLIDETITCGQAFGGGLEAVNLYSGLLAARHVVRADVAIVAIGPGIPGTSTPFGHSGVAQGQTINAASSLGGDPVAVLRLSFADERPRHVPVSHQTLTALGSVALASAVVPVPGLAPEAAMRVDGALDAAGIWARHTRIDVPGRTLPDTRGIDVRTMGRDFSADPAFFLAAAAAGTTAARAL
ncbi:MAG: DUF3866 family protein [Coriobacteriia bacterium]